MRHMSTCAADCAATSAATAPRAVAARLAAVAMSLAQIVVAALGRYHHFGQGLGVICLLMVCHKLAICFRDPQLLLHSELTPT